MTMTDDDQALIDRLARYRTVLDDAIAADVAHRRGAPYSDDRPIRQRVAGARRRLLAAAALVILGVAGLVVVDARRTEAPLLQEGEPSPTSAPAPDSTSPIDPEATSVLAIGDTGPGVRALQERLTELGFVVGDVDGVFGASTRSAVWAFEKTVMGVPAGAATGVVDPAVQEALAADPVVSPKATSEDVGASVHVEVWLPEQVLVVVERGRVALIAHASTGSDESWCAEVTIDPGEYGNERGDAPLNLSRCGEAITPGGTFTVHRTVDGSVRNALGEYSDPLYFNYGLAISASHDVPLQPVSRGEVRVPMHAITPIHELVSPYTPVWVFDGARHPVEYGEQIPRFDRPDPGENSPPSSDPLSLVIGDQVLLGAAPSLAAAGVVVDAEVNRQLVDLVPLAPQVAELDLAAVVLHVGTNGTISAESLDAVLDAFAGVPDVVVVTVRADRSWIDGNNALIRAAAEQRDNVTLLDWERLADDCPGECFYADDIHLRPAGGRYLTDLLLTALGLGEA